MDSSVTVYRTSSAEMDRRRESYTWLITFISLAAVVSSIDLLVNHPLVTVPFLVGLIAILILSRVLFLRSFDRYTRVVWSLSDYRLVRILDESLDEYPLQEIRRLRVKKTVDGRFRAIRINFSKNKSLYINALVSPDEFYGQLIGGLDVPDTMEVREPLDYDSPWFYRLLGIAIGVILTSLVRLSGRLDGTNARLVYVGLALYILAFGAYWLHAMPVSASYGEGKRSVDVVVGLGALLIGTGLGIGVFLLQWN